MIIKMTEIKKSDDPISDFFIGMWCKDIFLRKNGQIIGLHAIGEKDSTWDVIELDGTRHTVTGFRQWEQWGNEYGHSRDGSLKMIGRGSFRVHDDIEKVAKELEEDGWVTYEEKGIK
jgi:hypothetical protein